MKRRCVIITIAALILLGFAGFYFTRPKEPTYEGKTLTQWLRKYRFEREHFTGNGSYDQQGQYTGGDFNAEMTNCMVAVRAIGTNGIPTLLKLMKAKDLPGERKLQGFSSNQVGHHPHSHALIIIISWLTMDLTCSAETRSLPPPNCFICLNQIPRIMRCGSLGY